MKVWVINSGDDTSKIDDQLNNIEGVFDCPEKATTHLDEIRRDWARGNELVLANDFGPHPEDISVMLYPYNNKQGQLEELCVQTKTTLNIAEETFWEVHEMEVQ